MKLSALLKPAIDAKLPHEVIMGMVLAFEAEREAEVAAASEAEAERKAKGRQRWHRWKEKNRTNVSQHLPTTANDSRGGVTRVEDITSNSKIEPKKEEQKESALSREFDQFWTAYPNKVGKPKARVEFVKARKTASLEAILSGLSRYVASKPADRAWLNPATFLHQERWDDQPANVVPMARGSPALRMDDFLGAVIEQQEQRNARPDPEVESYSPHVQAISRGRWTG
jgi:hypothetical protein